MVGLVLILFVGLASAFFAAMAFGAAKIPLTDVKAFILQTYENENTLILEEMRFPRIIASGLVGMALAVAGAYMQGMTRNPLASPSLFGLTAGASAALALSLAFFKNMNYYSILLVCLVGSIISGLMVFLISMSGKHSLSNNKTILAGAAVSTLLYAVSDAISLRFSTSKQMTMWASSGLIGVTMNEIKIVFPMILFCLIIALLYSRKLTLVSLDEELAISLGENVKKLRILFFFLVTFLTGAAIALSGSIVFAGLIIPHFVRKIVGGDYRHIIPVSVVAGAIFLILADMLSRIINAPYETPVTAIMAVVSYPIFLYVVRRGGGAFD